MFGLQQQPKENTHQKDGLFAHGRISLGNKVIPCKTNVRILRRVRALSPKDIRALLGVPISQRRLKCAMLPLLALRNTLRTWKKEPLLTWAELLEEDGVDAACRAFDDPGALEGVGQQRHEGDRHLDRDHRRGGQQEEAIGTQGEHGARQAPVGVGAHDLNVIVECEKRRVQADFYIKTFHHHNYPSAPKPEQIAGAYNEVPGYWCRNPQEVIEVMKGVQKPWIAFKVMAAGAIPPKDAFEYVYKNGADHVLAGMFDFEIAEDAQTLNGILPSAVEQGKIAGMAMAGDPALKSYPGGVPLNTYTFFGQQAISVGSQNQGEVVALEVDQAQRRYLKIVMQDNRLTGIFGINVAFDPGVMWELILRRIDLSSVCKKFLADPQRTARLLMSRTWR